MPPLQPPRNLPKEPIDLRRYGENLSSRLTASEDSSLYLPRKTSTSSQSTGNGTMLSNSFQARSLSKVYPLSLVEQKELDSFLEENLCTRQICPSKSPMAALVFFIKKKNGSLWLVSQMATYWFVIGGLNIQKAQKSKVRQAAKDVVKSEV